jgi:RNA polymerase sigma factor (sigma-70 family)
MSQFGGLRHLPGMVRREMSVAVFSPESSQVEALFVANEQQLGRFLATMVRDRSLAEDLLQETFLAAYRDRAALSDLDDPRAWLFGIARNRALTSLRTTRRMRRAVERLWASAPVSHHTDATDGIVETIGRVLGPDDRSLVILRYVHDFDAPTLAALTGRSPAAIRKRLERACTALAREIER